MNELINFLSEVVREGLECSVLGLCQTNIQSSVHTCGPDSPVQVPAQLLVIVESIVELTQKLFHVGGLR